MGPAEGVVAPVGVAPSVVRGTPAAGFVPPVVSVATAVGVALPVGVVPPAGSVCTHGEDSTKPCPNIPLSSSS